MGDFLNWLIENKKWLFSGVGVVIVASLLGWLYRKLRPNKTANANGGGVQYGKIYHGTNAYQAGRDININKYEGLPRKSANVKLVSIDIIQDRATIHTFRSQWLPETLSIADNLKAYGIRKRQFRKARKGREALNQFECGHFPIVDIKLRNEGDEPAFLAYLDLDISLIEAAPDPIAYWAFPVNWEYTLLLDPHLDKDFQSVQISQEVPPNGLDRFVVVIGHNMNYGEFIYVDYRINFSIRYNDNVVLNLGSQTVRIDSPVSFAKALHVDPRRIGFDTASR